ncbi:hypothetical protein [Streptomyces sp. NPDC058206]|uniref:hypothetical protein n=1 Tax=Streptomyces sp. NPDC058206 TaxID=3346382 RepID=UPI0036EDC23C
MTTSPKWRVALASAASAAVLVAAPLVGTQVAYAQPYPPPTGPLTLSATAVNPGDGVSFTGTGFASQQSVTALLLSTPIVLGHFQADGSGTAQGTVTVPTSIRAGSHVFRLTARNPNRTLSVRIRVLGHDGHGQHDGHNGHGRHDGHNGPGRSDHRPGLAATGSEKALAVSGMAAGLIATGGATMLAVRRRLSS